MGDKSYPSPSMLAADLLKTALEHSNKDLRSEVYCQIIKVSLTNQREGMRERSKDRPSCSLTPRLLLCPTLFLHSN